LARGWLGEAPGGRGAGRGARWSPGRSRKGELSEIGTMLRLFDCLHITGKDLWSGVGG